MSLNPVVLNAPDLRDDDEHRPAVNKGCRSFLQWLSKRKISTLQLADSEPPRLRRAKFLLASHGTLEHLEQGKFESIYVYMKI